MVVIGELKGTEVGEYPIMVGFKKGSFMAWGNEDEWVSAITVTYIIYEDSNAGRFVLTDEAAANHPYKFQYGEGFKVYDKDISEYVYSETDVVYMARLAFNDTLADLLAQFKNGSDIRVFDSKDVEITDMTKVLATGMVLRLMDGTTVLNQLTISVLGDIDGDGKIGTLDKAQLNAYTLGTRKLEGEKLLAGDIDGDGKIGTLDKAQLNAYTLGTRDLYSALTLKSARTASVASIVSEEAVAIEEVLASSEEFESVATVEAVESEVAVEENTVSVVETTEIVIEKTTSGEIVENSGEVCSETVVAYENAVYDTIKEIPITLVDVRRVKFGF